MSNCPDWTRLAAERDERTDAEPAWEEALEHFDSCSLCRRQALKADPTLIFRRLPEVAMSPVEERSEAESMRMAVAAMRTMSRLQPAPKARGLRGWPRWAVAAGIALATLSARGPLPVPQGESVRMPVPSAASVAPAAFQGGAEAAPMIEGLDRPSARLYHVDGDGLSVLMIYDESIDV